MYYLVQFIDQISGQTGLKILLLVAVLLGIFISFRIFKTKMGRIDKIAVVISIFYFSAIFLAFLILLLKNQ